MNYSERESYIGILLGALSVAKTATSGNAAIGTKTSPTSETKWVAGVKGTAMKAGTTIGGISARASCTLNTPTTDLARSIAGREYATGNKKATSAAGNRNYPNTEKVG